MHKKIGIIGGLSPESTVSYYLYITRTYFERFGDCGYPEIIIYSVKREDYHQWRNQERWDLITNGLVSAAKNLQAAGADFGLISTNTMHKVFDEVQSATSLPFIHIIDVTAARIKSQHMTTVGLMGTRHTMSDTFYHQRLARYGIKAIVPDAEDQVAIHHIIITELAVGKLREESKQKYLAIIEKMARQGVQGVILGCTEIPLLVKQEDCAISLFDTAVIHAEAALEKALGDNL